MVRFCLFILVLFLLHGTACAPKAAPPEPFVDPANITLDERIELSVRYIINHCGSSGRFVYVTQADDPPNMPPLNSSTYNQLRHAGTMYALALAYDWAKRRENTALQTDILTTYRSAAKYLHKRIHHVPGRDNVDGSVQENVQALWSPNGEDDLRESAAPTEGSEIKLGGTGLALVALCSLETIEPGNTPLKTLQELGNYICSVTQPDGSTIAKLNNKGEPMPMVSLYYPGEAALGLCRLYRCDPDQHWLDTAAKILVYLANFRNKNNSCEPDHWTLLSTAALFRWDQEKPFLDKATRQLLTGHAKQIVQVIVGEQIVDDSNPAILGAYRWDGTLCPVSTRLEGLTAALEILSAEKDAELRRQILASMRLGVSLLFRHQVLSGPQSGGMPRAAEPLPPSFRRLISNSRKFNKRVKEIRIDYVQHFLSAIITGEEYY